MSAISSLFEKGAAQQRGVQKTPELSRIIALPRRVLDLEKGTVDGKPLLDLTPLYATNTGRCDRYPKCPVCFSGSARLWPTQSAALLEAERGWGLLGAMGVGSGKTLVTLLLPDVFQSKRPVLIVPASLRDQLLTRDIHDYGRHFRLPKITVIAYEELSTADTADILERINPDLIVADECHRLAHYASARSKRFVRYLRANPDTRFCGLSGTVTRRSIRDYSHLAEIALRAGSPVPQRWSDLQEWADALDPIPNPLRAGALRVFSHGSEEIADVRAGFQRRLVDTPGVVATSESWDGASLIVKALRMPAPKLVKDALDLLSKTWQVGDEEIDSAMRLVTVARQLSVGFYYRWVWPNGRRDEDWLSIRAEWHKTVRQVLKMSREGLDSVLLVSRAAERGQLDGLAQSAWASWKRVRDRYDPTPPVEAVWIDKFLIESARAWAAEGPGIIWYEHETVAQQLGAFLPVYGSGTDAGAADPAREPVIACSIRAQGTGKNLQRYSRSLVLEPPASGAAWEQLSGRTHRPGQQADEVIFDVAMPSWASEGAMNNALSDAQYIQGTQGQKQKLLSARRIGWGFL